MNCWNVTLYTIWLWNKSWKSNTCIFHTIYIIIVCNRRKIIFSFPPVISVLHLADGHNFRTPGSLICVIRSLPEHHGWIELAQCQQSIGSTWDEKVSRIVLSLQKSEPHVHFSLMPPFNSSCVMHSCRFWVSLPQVRTTLLIPPDSKLQTKSFYFNLNKFLYLC